MKHSDAVYKNLAVLILRELFVIQKNRLAEKESAKLILARLPMLPLKSE